MTSIKFGLLGSLLVQRGATMVPVHAAKQRAVLAALLLNPNRAVPVEELIDVLWEDSAPKSARITLQNYVKRLRLAINDTRHSRIVTATDGYIINVNIDELDTCLFEVLDRQASGAASKGEWHQAARLLAAAQSLWRGQPLADIPSSQLFIMEALRLTEIRLRVSEARIDADLRLGRHVWVITELEQLISDHPLRERPYVLLMLALYQNGRQAEALQVYRRARRTLIDEVGVEPGPDLRAIHQKILVGDRDLLTREVVEVSSMCANPASAKPPVPRLLPPAILGFVGRERELSAMGSLACKAARENALGVAVISGSAGVGKTALAVHWGHQVAHLFPDGQLFVDLHGFGSAHQPVIPADAIRGLLYTLGARSDQIPADVQAQADLYRSMMARKRMLVTLDNVRDADQVRQLFPGSPQSLVVVTSRRHLMGLAAIGACLIGLDVFSESEGTQLLAERLGTDRVDEEQEAAGELIRLCAGLPLAIAVTAAWVVAHPGLSLWTLAQELRESATRLDALVMDDNAAINVRSVFS